MVPPEVRVGGKIYIGSSRKVNYNARHGARRNIHTKRVYFRFVPHRGVLYTHSHTQTSERPMMAHIDSRSRVRYKTHFTVSKEKRKKKNTRGFSTVQTGEPRRAHLI